MGTKNNPGPYDCYAKLEADEPYFVLRGKDPIGWLIVKLWVRIRTTIALGAGSLPEEYSAKLDEASATAEKMKQWAIGKGTLSTTEKMKQWAIGKGTLSAGTMTDSWIRKVLLNLAYGQFGMTSENLACTCPDIMLKDSTRHFKGCPLRVE